MVHLGMDCCFGFISDISTFSWINFLREWQTLATGVVAAIAACLLWRQVSMQKRQLDGQNKRYRRTDERRNLISQAQLPHALNDLICYLCEGFDYAFNLMENPPEKPKEAIDVVIKCIEYVDDESAKILVELSRKMQVYHARISNRHFSVRPAERNNRIYETAAMYGFVSGMLDFARGNSETITPYVTTRDSIFTSFYVMADSRDPLINMPEYVDTQTFLEDCPLNPL